MFEYFNYLCMLHVQQSLHIFELRGYPMKDKAELLCKLDVLRESCLPESCHAKVLEAHQLRGLRKNLRVGMALLFQVLVQQESYFLP